MTFTEGEKRWIKRHTEKSLKKLGIKKGTNMKPTKTKPAKKRPAKRRVVSAEDFAKRNPVLSSRYNSKPRC